MPIYEYRCPACGKQRDIILRMKDSETPQTCSCGESMHRLISLPQPAIIVVTNLDRIGKTLNDEKGGYGLPGAETHGERYKAAIKRGLMKPKPVIGIGF